VNAQVNTETRSRGIYDVVVYTTQVTLDGVFKSPDISILNGVDTALWNEAIVSLGISDLHNLGDLLVLDWNGEKINLSPGVGNSELIESGVSSPLKLEAISAGKEYKFSITFSISSLSPLACAVAKAFILCHWEKKLTCILQVTGQAQVSKVPSSLPITLQRTTSRQTGKLSSSTETIRKSLAVCHLVLVNRALE